MENTRRLERERVLELLYEAEIKGIPVADLMAELPTDPEPFVRLVIEGVEGSSAELDAEITKRAINWDLARIAVVDRLVLRIAIWELKNQPDTPVPVVISEAVELAKTFSTDESGRFVNGILGSMQNDR
jgi:N utilization substance protein B